MLRIDKDACTVTTNDSQAELANLGEVLDGGFGPETRSLARKWRDTRLNDEGLAVMHFDVDEYDALEEAIEDADIYVEDDLP